MKLSLLFLVTCGGHVDVQIPAPEAGVAVDPGKDSGQDVAPDVTHQQDAQPMICPSIGAFCDPGSPINFTCADNATYWRCTGISPNTTWQRLLCDVYPSRACDDIGNCVAPKVCP